MTTIVTGKINSGKTTTMHHHYKTHQTGDGFIALKQMQGDQVHSYRALRLSNNDTKLLAVHERFLEPNTFKGPIIGPYYFNQDTLNHIDETIKTMIESGVSPIYLDEIGLLEMQNMGLHKTLKAMLQAPIETIITAREDLLEAVIKKYEIQDVTFIQTKSE